MEAGRFGASAGTAGCDSAGWFRADGSGCLKALASPARGRHRLGNCVDEVMPVIGATPGWQTSSLRVALQVQQRVLLVFVHQR
eukprot:1847007-Pleurochrysis_carterae.AAC.6